MDCGPIIVFAGPDFGQEDRHEEEVLLEATAQQQVQSLHRSFQLLSSFGSLHNLVQVRKHDVQFLVDILLVLLEAQRTLVH